MLMEIKKERESLSKSYFYPTLIDNESNYALYYWERAFKLAKTSLLLVEMFQILLFFKSRQIVMCDNMGRIRDWSLNIKFIIDSTKSWEHYNSLPEMIVN